MKMKKWAVVFLCIALTFSVGCNNDVPEAVPETAEAPAAPEPAPAKQGAAMVLTNGTIYTVEGSDWDKEAAEAVAVDEDGMIVFVGSMADAEAYIGENTEVVELDGSVVFPGFVDSHCHTPGTAMTELYEIFLYDSLTADKTLASIAAFIEENPDLDAYWGNGFSFSIGGDPKGPKAEWLDEICADKPIILGSSDVHSYWLNSIAFEMNGLTVDTPVPAGGSMPIDPATGKLWGIITDAPQLITMEPNVYTDEQQLEAIAYFQEQMHAWGYTTMMGISPHDVDEHIFKAFEDSGDLKMRMNISGLMEPGADIDEAIKHTLDWKASLSGSKLLKVSSIKYFADGVVEGMTGYLSEPYDAAAGNPPGYTADFYWADEDLGEHFKKTIDAGLQVFVHSIGDAATEETLDALEYAQQQSNKGDQRNVLAHLQLVKDKDKVRMAEMNVIGNTQPFWHLKEPEWYDVVDAVALGEERAWTEYPVKSLADAGVLLTFSGDHPVSPVNNPFYAIEASVTRNLYDGEYFEVDEITDIDDPTWLLNPAERVTVKQAIEAYTINGAYQLFREDNIGSIAVGKFADFIVIDRDIFGINLIDISDIEVLATIFGGEIVYGGL